MGHVYYDSNPIPIPEFARVDKSSERVYIMGPPPEDGKKNPKRTAIGKLAENGKMYPNDNFKHLYPDLWGKYYNEKVNFPYLLSAGFLLLTWFIIYKRNIYDLLIKNTDKKTANFILDLVMYCIIYRDNSFDLFKERMSNTLLFSQKAYSGSEISSLLKTIDQDSIHGFRVDWMKGYFSGKEVKISITVDGSNCDSYVTNSNFAEKGHSKSGKSCNIISYVWVLDAETSDPITYFIVHGSVPDCKSFEEVLTFLKDSNAQIKVFIMDRNYCNHNVISELRRRKINFVIMMPANTYGYEEIVNKYKDCIVNIENIIDENGLLGVSEKGKFFSTYDDEGYINLYYSEENAGDRRQTAHKKIFKEIERLKKALTCGKNDVSVKDEFKEFIKINENNEIEYDNDAYIKSVSEKGFFSIASSEDYGAKEVNDMYQSRNSSEVGYDIIKNQLGFDTMRSHSDKSILARFFLCFIATIIRNEISKYANNLKISTNELIAKLARIQFILKPNHEYGLVKNSTIADKIFKQLNISGEFISEFTNEVNKFINSDDKVGKLWRNPKDLLMGNDTSTSTRKRGRPRNTYKEQETTEENKKTGEQSTNENSINSCEHTDSTKDANKLESCSPEVVAADSKLEQSEKTFPSQTVIPMSEDQTLETHEEPSSDKRADEGRQLDVGVETRAAETIDDKPAQSEKTCPSQPVILMSEEQTLETHKEPSSDKHADEGPQLDVGVETRAAGAIDDKPAQSDIFFTKEERAKAFGCGIVLDSFESV